MIMCLFFIKLVWLWLLWICIYWATLTTLGWIYLDHDVWSFCLLAFVDNFVSLFIRNVCLWFHFVLSLVLASVMLASQKEASWVLTCSIFWICLKCTSVSFSLFLSVFVEFYKRGISVLDFLWREVALTFCQCIKVCLLMSSWFVSEITHFFKIFQFVKHNYSW